jgi:LysM repeat protein
MLQVGQTLMIPVSGVTANPELANSKPEYMNPSGGLDRDALQRYAERASASASIPSGKKKITHVVKNGDTLSDIATLYHTSVDRLRGWNNLSRRRHIYPGQKLAVYVADSYQEAEARDTASTTVTMADESRFEKTRHVVERGQTLYSIGRQYNVPISDLMSWNGLSRSNIRPGDVLVVWTPRAAVEAGVR